MVRNSLICYQLWGFAACTRAARAAFYRHSGAAFLPIPTLSLKGGFNETSSIHKDRRPRRCRQRNRRACHRAVNAGTQVAPNVELSEIARRALWRGRDDLETRGGSHRQQIPDSM